MTRKIYLPIIYLALTFTSCQFAPVLEGDIIIENVNVVDVESGIIIPSKTVIIKGNSIVSIADYDLGSKSISSNIIDGKDKYLIPGLSDMHTHSSGDSLMKPVFLPLYLTHGITRIREMSGVPEDFFLRDSIAKELVIGPDIIVGSPLIDGFDTHNPGSHHILIKTSNEARNIVDTLKKQGFAFIKIYSNLSRENYIHIQQRAKELNMEVSGHIPTDVSAFEAIEMGHRTIEHMTGLELSSNQKEKDLRDRFRYLIEAIDSTYSSQESLDVFMTTEYESIENIDPIREDSLFNLIANTATWIVPTLITQKMISYPYDSEFIDPNFEKYIYLYGSNTIEDDYHSNGRLKRVIDYRMKSLNKLYKKGAKILAGSDIQGGITLHKELELLVSCGISPADALKTATINPSEYWGLSEKEGTVEKGKIANLVLLNKNPLVDIKNIEDIEIVIKGGMLFSLKKLDSLEANALSRIRKLKKLDDSLNGNK